MSALRLVARLFVHHTRKITGEPYVTHLYGTAHIVSQLANDNDVRVAALLHDVLEDIPANEYSADQLQADFGPRVLELVRTVTHDVQTHGPDEARRLYIEQLRSGPPAASLISGADMLYNGYDMLHAYAVNPQQATQVFGGESAVRREKFWHGRFEVIETKLGSEHPLVKQLQPVMKEIDAFHDKIR